MADVPLGCFLSGGIDSSVIAAAMKQVAEPHQPVLTFSIAFDDPRYDETAYATEVAVYLKTQHRKFTVKPDAAADLPLIAASLGEPFGDSSILPTHYLSREVAGQVKVALSGDGGDELFGGYERYRAAQLAMTARHFARPLQGCCRCCRDIIPNRWRCAPGDSWPLWMSRRISVMPAICVCLMMPSLNCWVCGMMALPSIVFSTRALNHDRSVMQAAAALDRLMYLPGDTLTKVDRASMLHGLEVRSPFLDKEIVQFAARLAHPAVVSQAAAAQGVCRRPAGAGFPSPQNGFCRAHRPMAAQPASAHAERFAFRLRFVRGGNSPRQD